MTDWTAPCEIEDCPWVVRIPERRCFEHGGDPKYTHHMTDITGATRTPEQERREPEEQRE